ncbi:MULTISPECIES: hypothetical protein [unclassified Duganella]|jgi:hypothetical protein|uniref:hypothetical protein n=1 Tax=unclassified Duganella TaxID=2636909 RepID=UPI00088DF936|nr:MULTISPECIES: hypothetical protein [unclassified Duganella]SDG21601.1 hypothetical protein SAMN05216320_103267 [Duganella sp. OV458]SDJ26708.1 hypothetical protein SAMN05428973_103219 [Duganella sp. OV510]
MYAVADIHFKKPVSPATLFAPLPLQQIQNALAQTVFSVDPASAGNVVYGQTTRSIAYIVVQLGPKQLQLHMECTLVLGSLGETKLELERVLKTLIDTAKLTNQKHESVEITIYAENNRIAAGRYRPFGEILVHRFRETIIGDALFALVPAVVTGMYSKDFIQACLTLGSAMLVMLIWMFVEAKTLQKEVSYEDV